MSMPAAAAEAIIPVMWRFIVAYFPKILAGPIERATTFLPQLVGGPARGPGPRPCSGFS